MTSRFLRPVPLLLCAALSLSACDALREHPEPPPPANPEPPPPPPPLTVTLQAESSTYCSTGWVTVTPTVEGGTPRRTTILLDGVDMNPSPDSSTLKLEQSCSSLSEGPHFFMARAWSGDQSFDSAPVMVVVDRTRPILIGWRPDTDFPTQDTPVELVFNEPIDAHSLHAPTELRDDAGFSVPHQAVLSEDGKVLRLVPTQPLHLPVTLHAALVQSDLKDLAGNALGITSSWEFDYWPFARMGPSPTGKDLSRYTFALNPREKDRPYIALTELSGTFFESGQFVVARWNGTGWERLPEPRAAEEVGRDVIRPAELRLAVPWDGLPVLAWCMRTSGTTSRIIVKRFDGTAWQPVGAPDETGSGCASFQMALDDSNPVLVHEVRATDLRVTRWDGKAWTQLGGDINANPGKGLAWNAALAVKSGAVFLAWSEVPPGESGGSRVFVWKYENGSWSPQGQPLSGSASGSAGKVALAVDSVGPLVAWTEMFGTPGSGGLYFARWKWAAEWTAPELLEGTTAYTDLGEPVLALDASEPWVAWAQGNSQYGYEIHYRRHRFSGWEPKQLVAGGLFEGFQLDADGYPWVAVSTNRTYTDQAVLLRPQ